MRRLSADIFSKSPPEKIVAGIGRTDLSGIFQRMRGKRNIEYTAFDGTNFIAKYCSFREGERRNNIRGLENEKAILDKLEPTGIVPRAGEIKYYPSEDGPKKARLLIESLNAVSFDHLKVSSIPELDSPAISEIVRKVFAAYQTMHEAGVCQIDVNQGNLMLQDSGGGLRVRLIDFELGLDADSYTNEDLEFAFRFLSGDYSVRFNSGMSHDIDNLKKAEIHRVAMTMTEWILGERHVWRDIDLPDEEKQEYDAMVEEVRPNLEVQVISEAKKDYQAGVKRGDPSSLGEDGMVSYALRHTLSYRIRETTISCSLEARLKEKGIVLDDDLLEFLKKALLPKIEDRPDSFL